MTLRPVDASLSADAARLDADHVSVDPTDDVDAAAAVALAHELLTAAHRADPPAARRRARRLTRLVDDPASMAFSMALTDEVARIVQSDRAVARLRSLLAEHGAPAFLGPVDRMLLRAGATLGSVAPGVVAAELRWRLLDALVAPRLVVRTRGLGNLTFHAADPSVLQVLDVLVHGQGVPGEGGHNRRIRGAQNGE